MNTQAINNNSEPTLPRGFFSKLGWHWQNNPKLELAMTWWVLVAFYQLFGIVFVGLARVMPPPHPWWSPERVVQWFTDNQTGIVVGFGIIFLVAGLTAAQNALIGYSIRRMSVSKAFAYAYIAIYSLATIPGMLYCGIFLTVGALRPDRDPVLQSWLYDTAFLTFNGTMGVFLIGTIVWMIAILKDKNNVFPKWFAYLNICNAITELVISPAWIIKSGPFSWNGVVTFWIDTGVFVVYTTAFILLLKNMIDREDYKTGVLPAS